MKRVSSPIIKNLYTYIHTYVCVRREEKKRKSEANTTLTIYSKENYKKFRQILDINNDNVSSFLADIIEIILEQYDLKAHSLDKFLNEIELLVPTIETEPEKVLKYLRSLSMDKVKILEEKIQRDYVYVRAITNGEIELEDYPYLWRKYHP